MKSNVQKIILMRKDEVLIGKQYSDGSSVFLIRLYPDVNNTFQMEFLTGSDVAYTFLPECTELLDILRTGIVGMSVNMIGQRLVDKGYLAKSKIE